MRKGRALGSEKINIIGAGSLGGYAGFLISQMISAFQAQLAVYDADRVAAHNVRNQIYRPSDAAPPGKPKVEAFAEIMRHLELPEVEVHHEQVVDVSRLYGIVIVLVDSLDARRKIFASLEKIHAQIPLFIDARTGEHEAVVFVLDPRNRYFLERYRETLHGEGTMPPCANQLSVPTLWMVAAVIAKALAGFYGQKYPKSAMWEAVINMALLPALAVTEYTA